MKKAFSQFLDEVIIPIEKGRVIDDGKLYQTLSSNISSYYPFEFGLEDREHYWKVVNGKPTQEWENFKYSMAIYTLPILLFCDLLQDNLFIVEHEEPHEKLRLIDIFGNPPGDIYEELVKEMGLKEFQNFYDSLPNGMLVKNARISNQIKNWNYHTSWQFSIDCIQRVLKKAGDNSELNNEKWPGVFDNAMQYINEYKKWFLNQKEYEHLNYYTKYIGSELNRNYVENKDQAIIDEINTWVRKKDHPRYTNLMYALANCMSPFSFHTNRALRNARTQMGILKIQEYSEKFDIPSFSQNDDRLQRILTALRKEELNWQIQYLVNLITI